MSRFDGLFEAAARDVAARTSRRSVLARIGKTLIGAAALMPVLPIDRLMSAANAATAAAASDLSCDYWKYCAVDGFLCGCCGGSSHECPAGTEISKISWIGTCHNKNDGKNYLVSYNDCCGQTGCTQCFCNNNVGDRPGYTIGAHNDINWCMGNSNSTTYHCTVAAIVGKADG
jgi:methylamine dehydrogenase light chain